MTRPCFACGSAEKRLLYAQPLIVPERCLYGGYDIVVCSRCGFVYADNTLSQAALDEYYESLNKTAVAYYDPEGATDRDDVKNAHRADNILPHLAKSDRILDVGCGTGRFLRFLRDAGHQNVVGLEPSGLAVGVARERYGIEVFPGSLFDHALPGRFDFIILSHVLEHVVDLRPFIERLRSLLSANGKLYVEVPDAHQFHLFADPLKPAYSLYVRDLFVHFSPEHVNFFSPVSLRSLMVREGFDRIYCDSQKETAVVASIWQAPALAGDAAVRIDTQSEPLVQDYIRESERIQSPALARIREVAAAKEEILVWGAGLHTQRLLASGGLAQANIRAFVDSDPAYRGSSLMGKPIVAADETKAFPGLPILISSWKSETAIARKIGSLGLANPVILLYQGAAERSA